MTKKPFLFDNHIFEDDHLKELTEKARIQKPAHTDDELEAAKAEAFEQGRKAGMAEQEDSITREIATLLKTVQAQLQTFHTTETQRHIIFENDSAQLCATIFQTLYPTLEHHYGAEELSATIKTALAAQDVQADLTVQVAPDQYDALAPHLEKMATPITAITAQDTITTGQCAIKWPHGGIFIDRAEMAQKICGAINQALAERGIKGHDETAPLDNDNAEDSGHKP